MAYHLLHVRGNVDLNLSVSYSLTCTSPNQLPVVTKINKTEEKADKERR